ncbi:MAG TPA: Ig-like domain-containing protein [Verrucomicrobiae bacterium]|nr:Ig-like domain-containing protein [Verrucomicrobiae bacterium]
MLHLSAARQLFAAIILFIVTSANAAPPADDLPEPEPIKPTTFGRVDGELIVRFKAGTPETRKAQSIKKVKGAARDLISPNARVARSVGKPQPASEQLKIIKVEGNFAAAKATLEKDPEIVYVEPNFKTRIEQILPNDFEFEALYAMQNTGANGGVSGADIKAPQAWDISTGSRSIVVAVVDTGIDYLHEDLRANIWTNPREIPSNGIDDDGNGFIDDVHGYDFVSNDSDPFDDHLHGTHVSGTIGALGNNGIGVVGVCWQVSLMGLKAFNEQGNGDVATAVSAIHYAIANGARVINASWSAGDRSRALADAIAEAEAAGVLVVAAAGNSHTASPFYPAAYDTVLAVASVNNKDLMSPFSNFGPHVDLSAPGEQIVSTIPDSRYDAVSGTSMSTPHVAGAAALILSQHPEFTPAQVITILKNTTDPVTSDSMIGRGRLNVFKAMQIDVPLPFATLKIPAIIKGRVKFDGTAAGQHFQRYALSYGTGARPTEWTEFFNSTAAITNSALFSNFDSSILNDGAYTFRLEVWNDNGQSASDLATVQVQNVQLAFPLSADILRAGEPLVIRGTVFGQGRRYGLEWSRGLSPTEWFSTGFTIPANGEVLDGALGVFDTSLVASNDFYSFRLSATNASGDVQQFSASYVWLDSRLRPGWPIYLPYDGDYAREDWRQPKVADLDGDGHKEVIIVDHGNAEGKIARLIVYRDNGTIAWSRELNHEEPYADVPTIADLNGDGKLEILVDVGETFYAFDYLGNTAPGAWPVTLNAKALGKIVADLEGDGKPEIITLANSPGEGSSSVSLAIYDAEGHALQRWTVPACAATNITQRSFPVAANMDDDPELEVVIVGGCGEVMMFDTSSPAGPVWTTSLGGSALNSPIVADLDHDGSNDIIVATWTSSKDGAGGVYRLSRTGQIAPGFPVLTDDAFLTPPAVGDVDGDGFLEICVAGDRTFRLHLLEHDGFEAEGWPISLSHMSTSGGPTLADINGDSFLEVIYTAPGYMNLAVRNNDPHQVGGVAAWTRRGAPISLNAGGPYLPLPIEGASSPGYFKAGPATITDLDGNGKLDIVATSIRDRTVVPIGQSASFKNRSTLYAWELNAPSAQTLPSWTEFNHGANNNSFVPTPKPPPKPPEILPIPNQVIAIGQPFPPLPLDQYLLFPGEVIPGLSWSALGASALTVQISAAHVAVITTPAPAWEGIETITFTVTDDATFTRSVQVMFEARRNFIPPVANPDEATATEDTPVQIAVLANDQNPLPGSLRVVGVSNPLHGAATLENGLVSYLGHTNYFGDDTFAYVVENDSGARAFGAVTVHLTPVNDLPTATDDRSLTFEDRSVLIDVLANDKDADDDALMIVDVGPATDGTVSLADNKILFQPKPGFNGTNSFFYSVSDGKSPAQQARVIVMVRPLNNAPVAKAQSVVLNRNTSKDIIYLADDLEGDPVTFRVIRGPAHGELFSYPTLGSYTPYKGYSGTDSFTYKATDGLLESGEATVDITILATNNPPVASPLNLMTRVNQAVSINLTATDYDDDPVTFQVVTQPTHGLLVGSGSNYIYTPHLNYLGKDEFIYTISDGAAETTGKVSIETTDKNTAPGANVKFVKTTPNTPVTIVLSGADAESNPLTFALTSQPKHGILEGDTPYLLFTPQKDYVGPDRLRFTVSDGEFTSDPAAVTISIAPKNTLPTSANQTVTIPRGGPGVIQLDARDVDLDPLQAVILKGPRAGRLFGNGTLFTYIPNNNFSFDTFTYRPWDGRNFGPEAQVRIEQSSTPPVAEPRFAAVNLTAAGLFELTFTNQFGKAFRIESSPDLRAWNVLTNITSSSGNFRFSAPPSDAQVYYRAVQ